MPRSRKYKQRIFLHPGMVTSRNDGDRHYIKAAVLASLYRVNLQDCIVVDGDRVPTNWIITCLTRDNGHIYPVHMTALPDDVHLYPRLDGKYPLTTRFTQQARTYESRV